MISIDRAKTILECYGGHPAAWPQPEKEDLQQAIAHSNALKILQQEAQALDEFMSFNNVEKKHLTESKCAAQIMANLPKQNHSIEQLSINYIENMSVVYKQYINVFRPILLAASIVLVVIGLSNSFKSLEHRKVKNQETKLLSLSEYMDLYVDDGLDISNETSDEADELEILAFLDPQIMEDNN